MNYYDLTKFIKQKVFEITSSDKLILLLKRHFSRTLYQNTYYLIGSNAVISIFSMVLWVVAARFYSTYAIGLGSAIIASWELLSIFSNLGLGISLLRFLPGAGYKSNNMINTCFTLVALASIFVALIFLSGIKVWSPALLPVTQNPVFMIAFLVCAIVWGLNTVIETPFLAKRSVKYSFVKNTIIVILRLFLVIIFVYISKNALGIVASAGISMSAGLLITAFWFMPKILPGYVAIPMIRKDTITELIRYSGANYVSKIFIEITPFVLPLVVIYVLGAEMNAYFYIAWSIARIIQVIPTAIFNSLFAELSNDEKSLKVNVFRSIKLLIVLMLPAILIIIGIASLLLQIFGVVYSDNGALILRIMALSAIPYAINYLYITICRVKKYIMRVIVVSALSNCLTLGLIWFFMENMKNLTAVALGYIIGQGVVAILTTLLVFWELRSEKRTSYAP